MKTTKIPIIAIILILLGSLTLVVKRKNNFKNFSNDKLIYFIIIN